MISDGQEDDVEASLARLRMFLAPHKPTCTASDFDRQRSDAIQPSDKYVDVGTLDDGAGNDRVESHDDISSDLSTLAEQFSSSAGFDESEQEVHQHETTRTEPVSIEEQPVVADDTATFHPPVPTPDAVATVSPISVTSRDYLRVKYLLQCSLPGVRVHDDMVMWDMKNPVLAAQYDAHAHGLLELESWVEVNKLSVVMGVSRSNGDEQSRAGEGGKTFTTGSIELDLAESTSGKKQLVLCKIAVGRSLPIDSEHDAKGTPLPPGYHSYYLRNKREESQNCSDFPEHKRGQYRHQYIISDALQILPQYLVRFSYSAMEYKAAHLCALCEKEPAALVCKACDAELCHDCDKEVHSANKLVERHKRSALRDPTTLSKSRRRHCDDTHESINTLGHANEQIIESEVQAIVAKQVEIRMSDFQGTCQFHDGKKIEFYCRICATPVCVNCKMVGDHSIGAKGAHRLLALADAYEQSIRDSFRSDPLVDSRRSVIESKLSLIAQWEKDIERNREQVAAAIKQQYEQALAKLDEEVMKKTSVLKGESLEFIRQLQHIDWLDDCLDERRSSCSVVEFLSTWDQHKLLRAEQRDFPVSLHTSQCGDQVKADLQLVGHLQVVCGDQVLPRLSFSGSDFGDTSGHDDRYDSRSPRSSIGGVSSPPTSVRRTSDNEIRRKLLSMRSIEKRPSRDNHASSGSPIKGSMGVGTLSPEARKMMDEIRNDLFARRTVRSTSGSVSPALGSPTTRPTPGATTRMFSIQPVRGLAVSSTVSAPPKARANSAAWAALLRHELAASKESASGPETVA